MVITGSIPFFIAYSALGAILGNVQPKESNRYYYLLGFLIASGLTAYLTYDLSAKNNKFTQDFYAYESVLIMWASACIFLYIKSLGDKRVFGILTSKISNASLPIYGVHAIVLDLINSNNLRFDNLLFDFPVTFFTVFISSFAIGLLISKIDKKRLIS